MTFYSKVTSPIGELTLVSDGTALTGLFMRPLRVDGRNDDGPFAMVREQLEAYWSKELTDFAVPLEMSGTPFQKSVWNALRTIPYGETASYKEIAERVRSPRAVRAVGRANGSNPISIIVPCHRVIGANGSLTGYGGGLDNKRFLLDLERG